MAHNSRVYAITVGMEGKRQLVASTAKDTEGINVCTLVLGPFCRPQSLALPP